MLQKIQFWQNGSPLAYQNFANNNFGQHSIISYEVQHAFNGTQHCVDISRVKSPLLTTVYPHRLTNKTCTMMLLSNLAEPEWVYVDCNDALLAGIICVKNSQVNQSRQNLTNKDKKICLKSNILISIKCYSFVWWDYQHDTYFPLWEIYESHNAIYARLNNIKSFQFLFDAISTTFPPIITTDPSRNNALKRFRYAKHLNVYKYHTDIISKQGAKGFHIFVKDK